MRNGKGWYATFALLVIVAFIVIYYLTGRDALGAAGRFLWNGLVLVVNGLVRLIGSFFELLARGVGWRRMSRLTSVVTDVDLSYAASVVLSDDAVDKARGWRGKLQAATRVARDKWQSLPLVLKLLAVAGLIASQLYLHFLLVIFPIAFLVPVARRLWVRVADLLFGSWYWKTFGDAHRATVGAIRTLPLIRPLAEGLRLFRLRYLYAWRLWRYHPRYRDPTTNTRRVSLIEPLRLWCRGGLDGYVGRPLLSGRRPAEIARECESLTSNGAASARRSETYGFAEEVSARAVAAVGSPVAVDCVVPSANLICETVLREPEVKTFWIDEVALCRAPAG